MNMLTHSLILNLNHQVMLLEMIEYLARLQFLIMFLESSLFRTYLGKEELAHTPSIASTKNLDTGNGEDKFLKIVKNITSKGFVRSNYEEKLVDLSDVRINLKTKN